MTSTIISDVKSKTMFLGNANNTGKNQNVQGKDCFSEVFDKTQNPSENTKEFTSAKTEETEKVQDYTNIRESKTSRQLKEQTEEVNAVKTEEDVETEVVEAADKMVEEIAKTFDVTVEDVELVLETLGLAPVDLLIPENLTDVVLALNPECDALSLMTNEGLFTDLKSLMNLAQELKTHVAQDYNLTEDEMNTILSTVMEKTEVPEVEIDSVPKEAELPEMTVEIAQDVVVGETEVVEVMTDITKEVSYERNDVKTVETIEVSREATVIPQTESNQNVKSDSTGTKEEANHAQPQQFAQNFVNQLAEAVENASGSTTSYGVSGQEIIRQITEQIRVYVKEDTTEMELQLHPASLGNVKVQLTSAGGVLTAVFTTENEAVKAALEAQLVQLKENFTEQGLKVESVEVNVSAQGFERSLDQQEQEQNRFEDTRNKKGNRRIRLNGLDDAEEFLSEEMSADDRIVADMMIRNGNTVDYTV